MNATSFPPFSGREPPHARTMTPQGISGEMPSAGRRGGVMGWIQENTFAPEWLPERLSYPLIGYLAAAFIVGMSTVLVLLLLALFPSFAFHGILVLVGVVLVAMGWGAGPGLLATLLGTFALYFVVLSPDASWLHTDPADGVGLATYLLVGAAISLLAGQNERARRQAEETTRLLTWAESRSRYEAERLRTVLEVLPSAVLITGKHGELLAVNQATKTLWGDDIPLGTSITEFPPDKLWRAESDIPVPIEEWPLARTLGTGEVVLNDELEIEAVDGQRRVILSSAAPLRDDTGAVTGAVMSAQDISDLRRLEREVTARAQELEAVFEAMTDGVFVFDAHGYVDRVNAAGLKLLGPDAHPYGSEMGERAADRSPRDQDGRPLPLESLPGMRILRGEVLTGAQAVDIYMRSPKGDLIAFSTSGTPLRNAEGSITGAVMVTRDVTERHQLEREAAERAQELEAIFEAMSDGIAVLDAQGMLIRTNRAFRALHGVEPDSDYLTLPLEQRLTILALSDDQGRPLEVQARPITRLLQGETVAGIDVTIKRLDERVIVLNIGGAPIRDERGHITGCVEVFRDVTTRHHLEERTHDTLDALVAMAEAIVAFRPSPTHLAADPDPASSTAAAGTTLALVARHLAHLTRSALGCRHVSLVAHDPRTGRLHPITAVGLPPHEQPAWWASWSPPPRLEARYGPTIAAQLVAGSSVALDRDQLPAGTGATLFGAQSGRIVPMRLGEELVGILMVAYAEPDHAFLGAELALTETLARLGALVLERDQLLRGWAETRARELALSETKAQMDTFLGIASHELKTPLTSLKLSLQLAERRLQALIRGAPGSSGSPGLREGSGACAEHEQAVRRRGWTGRWSSWGGRRGRWSGWSGWSTTCWMSPGSRRGSWSCVRRPRIWWSWWWRRCASSSRRSPSGRSSWRCPADARTRTSLAATPGANVPGGAPPLLVEVDAGRIEQVVTNFLTNALKYAPAEHPVEVGIAVEGGRGGGGRAGAGLGAGCGTGVGAGGAGADLGAVPPGTGRRGADGDRCGTGAGALHLADDRPAPSRAGRRRQCARGRAPPSGSPSRCPSHRTQIRKRGTLAATGRGRLEARGVQADGTQLAATFTRAGLCIRLLAMPGSDVPPGSKGAERKMSGSSGTTSVPDLCPAPGHTPFSRSVQGLWADSVLRSGFLAVMLLLAYQLVVTLLHPIWIGAVTDWLRTLLAWPTLLGVVLLSSWLTHAGRWSARSWWLVSAALLFYAVGRTLRTAENQFFVPNHHSFPSLPDVFSLLQYPFFLLALLLVPPVRPKMERARVALDACLLLGSAFLLSWYFLLGPEFQGGHETVAGKMITLTYLVGDLAIFVALVVIWLHYEKYEMPLVVVALVMAAAACLFIADSWAAALLNTSSYQPGSPPDLFWMAFYLLLPLAGLVQFRLSQHTRAGMSVRVNSQPASNPSRKAFIARLRVFSSVAAALVTGIVVIIRAYQGTSVFHPMGPFLAALALLGLALVRQGLAVVDNERLYLQREEALRNATAQMETFLGMAGHELKNPLASTKLSLQLAARRLRQMSQREPEIAPKLEPVLETMARAERQEHRLDRLVNELLDTSRIEAGKLELHLEPTDLVAIVREVVEEQSQMNPRRTLRLECPSDLWAPVLADADHIGEVVTNYLTNALKYSPLDRPVEVGVEVETQQAQVWVRDQGPGLPPEEQERIWERFHRAEGIEVQSGTGVGLGLGLHICCIIIEQHHGQVGVRSAPGQGSTFWFNLPLVTQQPAPEGI